MLLWWRVYTPGVLEVEGTVIQSQVKTLKKGVSYLFEIRQRSFRIHIPPLVGVAVPRHAEVGLFNVAFRGLFLDPEDLCVPGGERERERETKPSDSQITGIDQHRTTHQGYATQPSKRRRTLYGFPEPFTRHLGGLAPPALSRTRCFRPLPVSPDPSPSTPVSFARPWRHAAPNVARGRSTVSTPAQPVRVLQSGNVSGEDGWHWPLVAAAPLRAPPPPLFLCHRLPLRPLLAARPSVPLSTLPSHPPSSSSSSSLSLACVRAPSPPSPLATCAHPGHLAGAVDARAGRARRRKLRHWSALTSVRTSCQLTTSSSRAGTAPRKSRPLHLPPAAGAPCHRQRACARGIAAGRGSRPITRQ